MALFDRILGESREAWQQVLHRIGWDIVNLSDVPSEGVKSKREFAKLLGQMQDLGKGAIKVRPCPSPTLVREDALSEQSPAPVPGSGFIRMPYPAGRGDVDAVVTGDNPDEVRRIAAALRWVFPGKRVKVEDLARRSLLILSEMDLDKRHPQRCLNTFNTYGPDLTDIGRVFSAVGAGEKTYPDGTATKDTRKAAQRILRALDARIKDAQGCVRRLRDLTKKV